MNNNKSSLITNSNTPPQLLNNNPMAAAAATIPNDLSTVWGETKNKVIYPWLNFGLNLASTGTQQAISKLQSYTGIENPDILGDFKEKFMDLTTPKTPEQKQELYNKIKNLSQNSQVILDAYSPIILDTVHELILIGEKTMTDVSKDAIQIILNTAEEIPVAGVFIGLVRSIDKAIHALESITNTASDMSETVSTSIDKLIQRKKEIENKLRTEFNHNINSFTPSPPSPQMPKQIFNSSSFSSPSLSNQSNNYNSNNVLGQGSKGGSGKGRKKYKSFNITATTSNIKRKKTNHRQTKHKLRSNPNTSVKKNKYYKLFH